MKHLYVLTGVEKKNVDTEILYDTFTDPNRPQLTEDWVYTLLFQLAENNMAGLGIKRYFENDRIFKYVNKTEEKILCQYISACTNYNKKRFCWKFVKLRMFLHISSNMKEKSNTSQ